ncbi:glycosyltransferase 61 family protein [Brevibacillus sp. B_LB10_24]|uniref:glycosyltransferase 61 family protein n=1 Tax=Brevibacillus sp. B_LB10_24 TaxID=3380645 RepID=UPI0038BAF2EB
MEILESERCKLGEYIGGAVTPRTYALTTWDWLKTYYQDVNEARQYYLPFHAEKRPIRHVAKTIDKSVYHYKFQQFLQNPPNQFVAIVPGGRVYGHNGSVISPDNQLLWDVSFEFNKHPHQHLVFAERELPPIVKTSETLAVLTSVASFNYYHWMFDVLSRLDLLRRSGIAIDRYVFNRQGGFPFQHETLVKMMGIPAEKIIECDRHTHIEAQRLVVSSIPGCTGQVPRWVCDFLRQEMRFNHGIEPVAGYERIYISRANTSYRRVTNEREVVRFLEAYGFQSVTPEFYSVWEQVQLFASAQIVVAPHGAALTNLIFCNPGTKIVEMFAPNYVHPVYWVPSHHLDMDYYYLTGEGVLNPANSLNVSEDIFIDLDKLAETLKLAGVIGEERTDDFYGFQMRVARRLQRLLQRDGTDFIAEVYRDLLNREPDPDGLRHMAYLLASGVSKLSIVLAVVKSEECIHKICSTSEG